MFSVWATKEKRLLSLASFFYFHELLFDRNPKRQTRLLDSFLSLFFYMYIFSFGWAHCKSNKRSVALFLYLFSFTLSQFFIFFPWWPCLTRPFLARGRSYALFSLSASCWPRWATGHPHRFFCCETPYSSTLFVNPAKSHRDVRPTQQSTVDVCTAAQFARRRGTLVLSPAEGMNCDLTYDCLFFSALCANL